jgi:hypothetical protein
MSVSTFEIAENAVRYAPCEVGISNDATIEGRLVVGEREITASPEGERLLTAIENLFSGVDCSYAFEPEWEATGALRDASFRGFAVQQDI